jgi:hypothetical protein
MRRARAILAYVVLCIAPAPAAAQAAGDAAVPGDAYLDEGARQLVRDARARRRLVDNRIRWYEATAVERLSIGLRAGIGERLLVRRETASRISWTRDTVRVHVVGAREVMPPVRGELKVPADLEGYMPALAFDPVDSEMLLRFDTTGLRDPLAPGGEAHYRFASGDTTVLRLPDGTAVRLHELRILPRRRDPGLLSGSYWVDDATHAVVQAYFRLARAYDSRRDADDRSGFLTPAVHAELDYIAIDYGYWDMQWWLPRTVAIQGVVRVAGVRLPMSYERRYSGYSVDGDPAGIVVDRDEAGEPRPCRPRVRLMITTADPDSVRARQARRRAAAAASAAAMDTATVAAADRAAVAATDTAAAEAGRGDDQCDRPFIVTAEEPAQLTTSELLPDDIFGGTGVIDAAELRAIAERVRGLAPAPWRLERPIVQWGPTGPGLLRYNRVEGLSAGARVILDLGMVEGDATLRVGTGGGEVGAEAGITRRGFAVDARLAGYRRLDALDVSARPFGLGSSLTALLLGRDENDYFRATGAELLLRPAELRRPWWDVRLFAERHAAVEARASFSVPRLLDGDRTVRENVAAAPADQAGATLRLRSGTGLDPAAARLGGELELHGETGDFDFVRPALRLRGALPLGRRLAFGLEAAGGAGFGDVPPQRLWQLGGVASLRGYDGGATRGEAFWRTRAELGLGLPAARVALFTDAGRAGPRDDLLQARPLRSAGVGLSALDGLVRVDLARALDGPRGWRLHFQLDSVL